MKWLLIALLAMPLLAGCMQDQETSFQQQPVWIPVTINVLRGDDDPAFGAEVVAEGSPAPQGFVGFTYYHATGGEYAQNSRQATPTDPGCRGTKFQPVCANNAILDAYRVPRDIEGAENIAEIVSRVQPLGNDGKVVLLFPDPAEISFRLAGPASLDYPEIQDEANGGQGCSHYYPEDLVVLSGDGEDTSTESSAPRLRFAGPVEIELHWMVFPSDCE